MHTKQNSECQVVHVHHAPVKLGVSTGRCQPGACAPSTAPSGSGSTSQHSVVSCVLRLVEHEARPSRAGLLRADAECIHLLTLYQPSTEYYNVVQVCTDLGFACTHAHTHTCTRYFHSACWQCYATTPFLEYQVKQACSPPSGSIVADGKLSQNPSGRWQTAFIVATAAPVLAALGWLLALTWPGTQTWCTADRAAAWH